MITGAHFLLYSKDADADRAFIRDVLGFRFVDLGHNWLIFALPPTELAVHPGAGNFVQEHGGQQMLGCVLYLMCDDVKATVRDLRSRDILCSDFVEANWGVSTTLRLPSGSDIGLYQPSHKTAIQTD